MRKEQEDILRRSQEAAHMTAESMDAAVELIDENDSLRRSLIVLVRENEYLREALGRALQRAGRP